MKKQLSGSALWKSCSEKVEKSFRKTEVAEPIFVSFEDSDCNSTKRRSLYGYFTGKKKYFRASSVCNGGETAIHYSVE